MSTYYLRLELICDIEFLNILIKTLLFFILPSKLTKVNKCIIYMKYKFHVNKKPINQTMKHTYHALPDYKRN